MLKNIWNFPYVKKHMEFLVCWLTMKVYDKSTVFMNICHKPEYVQLSHLEGLAGNIEVIYGKRVT